MPTFDGDTLEIGDKLFDIYDNKHVTVVQVYKDRFMVRVPGRSRGAATHTYTYDGRRARRDGRTLFWHDPRVVIPRKNAVHWRSQREMVANLVNDLAKFIPDTEVEASVNQPDRTFAEVRQSIQQVDVVEAESPSDPKSKFEQAVAAAKAQQGIK